MFALETTHASKSTCRNIWEELSYFEESCSALVENIVENDADDPIYRLLCFVYERMLIRNLDDHYKDLSLRNVRDESLRCLAISYLNDHSALQSLIQKVKETDQSLEKHDDEYLASTPIEILFSGPWNLTSTHPDVTTSDHKFEHECEFDSFTEVD
jgi:hypothetical protein